MGRLAAQCLSLNPDVGFLNMRGPNVQAGLIAMYLPSVRLVESPLWVSEGHSTPIRAMSASDPM
jgi:hypothetical protein